MKTIKGHHEIFSIINASLPQKPDAVYVYGDTIYNPSGKTLTPDIEYHEYIHSKQQGDNPNLWWERYLSDPAFRLSQELEAYGEQWLFIKRHVTDSKMLRWAKENMALALCSKEYGTLMTYGEAESKIRHYK